MICITHLKLAFLPCSTFLRLDQSLKHSLLILTLLWTLSFHHQDSLPLDPKPLDSRKVSFATCLMSCSILSLISFALPCSCHKPPYKRFCLGKIFVFPTLNVTSWSSEPHCGFLSSLSYELFTSITNTLCWIDKLSRYNFTVQTNLSVWFLNKK